MKRLFHIAALTSVHRRVSVVVWLVLLTVGTTACANYDPALDDFAWGEYSMHKERYAEDRARLAQAIQEVLIHQGYTFRDGTVKHLATPGENGFLETEWNDREARPMMYNAYEGYRRRVHLEIREDVENIRYQRGEDDEGFYWREYDLVAQDRRVIALGIAVAEERNTRQNFRPGDYENADWEWAGFSEEEAVGIHAEVNRLFRTRDPDSAGEGSMSDTTTRILQNAGDTRGTGATGNPDSGDEAESNGIYGPDSGNTDDDPFRDLHQR